MKLFYECKDNRDLIVGKGGCNKILKFSFTKGGKPRFYLYFKDDGHLEIKNKNKETIFSTRYEG